MNQIKLIFSFFLLLLNVLVVAQSSVTPKKGSQIEILSADQLVYDRDIGKYQRCLGSVRFKQDQVYMNCDSAWFYEEENKIEAFGNIYIRQRDTFNLWGQHLLYNGDTKKAIVDKDVRLTDNKMKLRTQRLDYDLNNKTAYYVVGGEMENGEDRLKSKKGTYYSRSKEFFFKDNVVLTNPDYTMTSDTLRYNTLSKIAYFYGPTFIRSEENTIFCNYGWYDTERNISQFSKRAYIEGEENRLQADSMIYNRNTGFGEAFGNLELTDTIEEVKITGNYGNYHRFTKTTFVTGQPKAVKMMDGDSLFLSSDTMVDQIDSNDTRTLTAFKDVKVFKSDMQSVSDSMIYNFTDSTISLFIDPILWTDSTQITGDTIIVFRNKGGIHKLRAFNNGFIIEKDINAFYNQIAGKTVDAFFKNGKLNTVNVNGNGQSIYYAAEDSVTYSGVNDIVCGSMVIYMDSSQKVKSITFLSKPKATFYPLDKFPPSKSRLNGFQWQNMIRPSRLNFN